MQEKRERSVLNGIEINIPEFAIAMGKTWEGNWQDFFPFLAEKLIASLLYYVAYSENIPNGERAFEKANDLLIENSLEPLRKIICEQGDVPEAAECFEEFYGSSDGLSRVAYVKDGVTAGFRLALLKVINHM